MYKLKARLGGLFIFCARVSGVLVFSNREAADATFIVDGVRIAKKISRFPFPR